MAMMETIKIEIGPSRRLAWLPIPLLIMVMLALWLADIRITYEIPILLTILNFTFSTLASLAIAFLMGRVFLAQPTLGPLIIGGSVLIWGVGSFVGPAVGGGSPNIVVTIHNICVWLAAGGNLAGIILFRKPVRTISLNGVWIATVYMAALGMVWLVTQTTLAGRLPLFFIQNVGGTTPRQFMLGSTITILAFAATLLYPAKGKSLSAFNFWYAFALLLLATGLFGVMIQPVFGSILGWAGRTTQYLAGLYMLAAAFIAPSGNDFQNIPLQIGDDKRWPRYLAVMVFVIAAVAIRMVFLHNLGLRAAFSTFYPAVMLAALYGGLLAGILATVFSAMLANYFWMAPVSHIIAVADTADALAIGVFCVSGIMISLITEVMLKARVQAGLAEAKALHALALSQTAEALRETEERLRFAMETSHTGAWDLDLVGHTAFRSLEHDHIFGYAELLPEWTYEMFLEHILPEDRMVVDAKFQNALQNQGNWSFECRIRRIDGEIRWIWAIGRHYNDTNNGMHRMSGIVQDITDRKQAEEVLQASEARYRTLFETMTEGFTIGEIIYDESGQPCDLRYLVINPAIERLMGLKAREIIGRTTRELFPGVEPIWFERYGRVALTGEPAHFEEWFAPLGRCFKVSAFQTELGRFATIFSDITERKQAEEKLLLLAAELQATNTALLDSRQEALNLMENAQTARRQAEQSSVEMLKQRDFTAAVLDNTSALVVVLDLKGRITRFNRACEITTGYTSEEALGRVLWKFLIPPEDMAGVRRTWESISLGNFPNQHDNHWLTKDGSKRCIAWSNTAIIDADGKVEHIIGTGVDITERKRSETRIAKLTKLYMMLSAVNEAIVRIHDEKALYAEVCRIVGTEGEFPLVWIGECTGRQVVPVASFGPSVAYLKEITVEIDGPLGCGPTGTAIREDRPIINDDFDTNPSMAPWHEPALRHGFRSSAAFPLHRQGNPIGALTLYATEPGAFDPEQVRLLEALASDLSYALDFIMQERLRVENAQQLRQTLELLDVVTKGTEVIIAAVDIDFRYTYFNAAYREEMKRLTGGDIQIGTSMVDLFAHTPEQQKIVMQEWCEPLSGRSTNKTLEFGSPGRHRRIYSVLHTPIQDAHGNVVGAGEVALDITDRKRAEEALQELNATLEQRVLERTVEVQQLADQLRALAVELSHTELRERKRMAMILHDHIQQLLVAAKIQLELVKHADRTTISSSVQGIQSIITQAIDASRSLTIELSPPILHQAGLAAALDWLADRLEENNLFKVHVRANQDDEPASESVRLLLFDSVRELLLNAVKHSGVSEAHVTMVRTPERWTQIIVEDHGVGFNPDTLKSCKNGTFGIFTIQQRLTHIGGRIEVESEPGYGTRVILLAPPERASEEVVEPSTAVATANRPEVMSLQRKDRKITVLLADDHQLMRQGISSILQFHSDIEVIGEAADGWETVRLARMLNPDVVVMDINMPIMNGIEATQIITKELPHVGVIGLSMHIEPDVATAMQSAGAFGYITKGGPSEKLIEAIRACVTRE